MTRLLVSVRSAAEAVAALRGGAGLIDVKEPANGPLGKADDAVIAEVVRVVAGRAPVSAALGEWKTAGFNSQTPPLAGLTYVKLGLAGCARYDWRPSRDPIACFPESHCYPGAKRVFAAYADSQEADSPPVDEVCEYVRKQVDGVFLVDTFTKDAGKNLLDYLPMREVELVCKLCRSSGVQTALAGSLRVEDIRKLLFLRPDWIAVRGAACDGGREGAISEVKVQELAALLNHTRHEN